MIKVCVSDLIKKKNFLKDWYKKISDKRCFTAKDTCKKQRVWNNAHTQIFKFGQDDLIRQRSAQHIKSFASEEHEVFLFLRLQLNTRHVLSTW